MLKTMTAHKTVAISPALIEYVDTPDGFSIRTAVFSSRVRPNRGTVLLLTGRNEMIEKYDHIIADLSARGLDVVTFDWRGQGRSTRFYSDGRRGYVDNFDQYAADLELVFAKIALPEARPPFYILAHSTGALIALGAAPQLINRIKRMVLVSPLLSLADRRLSTAQIHAITSLLSFFGLNKAYAAGGPAGSARLAFATNLLTTDLELFERNKDLVDPKNGLGLGGPSVAWVRAATLAMMRIADPEHLARIHIPTLLIAGAADRLVSTAAIEDYALRLRSGALVMIDGARHEIMQEAPYYRNQFLAAFDAFVPGSD